MEKTTEKFERFIERLAPSSSSLFIGADEERARSFLDVAARQLNVKPFDICILEPEIKTGKNKSIFVSSARNWIHDINITPSGPCKIGVIMGAEKMNHEAANTLLKTLEEPPKYAFLFIFSATDNLLATIKSRCKIFHLWNNIDSREENEEFGREALKKYFYEQSKEIEKVVKENKVNDFLNGIERFAQEELRHNPSVGNSNLLKEIYKVKKRIKQNANSRLQLENLFLKYKG